MTERIIASLSEIDEKHLISYQRIKNDYQRSKGISRRWISIAAVMVLILGGTLFGWLNNHNSKEPGLIKETYKSYDEMIEDATKWSDEYNNTLSIHLPKNASKQYADMDYYSYSGDNTGNTASTIGKIFVVALKKNATWIKIFYQPLQNEYFIRFGVYNPDIDYDDLTTVNNITVRFKQIDGVIEGYFSDRSGNYFLQFNSISKEAFVTYLYELLDSN